MAKQFKTVLRRARFVVSGIPAEAMQSIAQETRNDVEQRILRAQDVYDAPAPPLSNGRRGNGYLTQKARKAPPAVRNWRFTGRTLRSMRVLSASQNKATIGFTDAESNRRAFYNNRRVRQFGISRRNQAVLIRATQRQKYVQVKAA